MDSKELDDTLVAGVKPASEADTVSEKATGDGATSGWPTGVARYRVGDVLGRGGMGEVLSARDEQIGRAVAIKRMRAEDPPPGMIARFLREVRIQGRLDHPAIVPVHELLEDARRRPYFVMKQLAGVSLENVIGQLLAGEPDTIARYTRHRLLRAFSDVCLAIEFAHTRGVIHRDLKPANIMLGDFGEVYVLDWGIAKVAGEETGGRASFLDIDTLDGETVAGAVMGTPGYMSPEQVRGDDVDVRSDVYALGCIMFEIIVQKPLHEERGRAAMQSALIGVEARPSVRFPDLETPPELDAICLAATMHERDDRYATARQLSEAVQRFLDGDRDVALRKELADKELAKASTALSRGETPTARKVAIRAAARALALDPKSVEAADLAGRLMLEPPKEVPPEVEDSLAKLDVDALFAARRLVIIGALSFLGFLPLMYVAGFRAPWFHLVGVPMSLSMFACAYFAKRDNLVLAMRLGLVFAAVMIGLYARVTTPFLIAPCVAVVTVMSATTHPSLGRPAVLATGFIAAVLIPWFLEILGVVSTTTQVEGHTLMLTTSAGTALDSRFSIGALVVYVCFMVSLAALLSASLMRERRGAQRLVQIQAWQLGQLMPRARRSGSVSDFGS